MSHLHSGRNRSPPASRFPADSDRIDTASYVHGFAVSYRLHRPPSFRSLETRALGPDGRRATHPCDKVPKEPPCSSSRKCTLGIAAVCRCSQPDRDNHIHGLHFPAGCRASLFDSEQQPTYIWRAQPVCAVDRDSAAAAFRTSDIHLQSGRSNSVRETVRLLRGTWLR